MPLAIAIGVIVALLGFLLFAIAHEKGPSAPTPARSATSGPAPRGSSSTAGRPLTRGPTSTTGSHTLERTRAERAASVSPSTTRRALSVPMRVLAPPVSSTPAIWRMRAQVWPSGAPAGRNE